MATSTSAGSYNKSWMCETATYRPEKIGFIFDLFVLLDHVCCALLTLFSNYYLLMHGTLSGHVSRRQHSWKQHVIEMLFYCVLWLNWLEPTTWTQMLLFIVVQFCEYQLYSWKPCRKIFLHGRVSIGGQHKCNSWPCLTQRLRFATWLLLTHSPLRLSLQHIPLHRKLLKHQADSGKKDKVTDMRWPAQTKTGAMRCSLCVDLCSSHTVL